MLSSMKSLIQNPILRFGIIGIVLYIALFFIYEPITLGLDVEDITILAVPTMVGMFLFQYFMSCTVFHRAFLGYGLVGLLWGLTFPLLFHWSIRLTSIYGAFRYPIFGNPNGTSTEINISYTSFILFVP